MEKHILILYLDKPILLFHLDTTEPAGVTVIMSGGAGLHGFPYNLWVGGGGVVGSPASQSDGFGFNSRLCLSAALKAVEFEPTPLRTGALSQRLLPLGQTVLVCEKW